MECRPAMSCARPALHVKSSFWETKLSPNEFFHLEPPRPRIEGQTWSHQRTFFFHISLGHSFYANTEQIHIFPGFSQLLVQCTKMSLPFWRASQAAGSPAPKFHPQTALFFAPKVSVAHQGKQQHVV